MNEYRITLGRKPMAQVKPMPLAKPAACQKANKVDDHTCRLGQRFLSAMTTETDPGTRLHLFMELKREARRIRQDGLGSEESRIERNTNLQLVQRFRDAVFKGMRANTVDTYLDQTAGFNDLLLREKSYLPAMYRTSKGRVFK